jgi:hypothetical protein
MYTSCRFDTSFSFEKSIHIIRYIIDKLGCSRWIRDLVDNAEWEKLLTATLNPSEYADAYQLWKDRQALAFFQKNKGIPTTINREKAAFSKFVEAEFQCFKMNASLQNKCHQGISERYSGASLRFEVMRKIDTILGDVPSLEELEPGFGPGSNVGLSRLTSIRRKLSTSPTVTTDTLNVLESLRGSHPHWTQLEKAEVVECGKLTFVPKSAVTDRSICVEPLFNTYIQKGYGRYIRSRLRLFGCNLNTQAKNQLLARIGSKTGAYATIDLSSASDTVSYELVKELLPYQWFEALCACRTPKVKYGDLEIDLSKFSSMGNGYTFELESLIFFALVLVITGYKKRRHRSQLFTVAVYGDDIIVPTRFAAPVIEGLESFGFSVNTEKTFLEGPFRESCGSDYFDGVNVRPCYLKTKFSVKELFRFHNYFVRNYEDGLANELLQFIPKRFLVFGPDGYGDGHLLGDHPTKRHKWNRQWGGYVFRSFTCKPYVRREPLQGDYAAFLYFTTTDNRKFDSPHADYKLSSELKEALYQERPDNPHYSLTRIYTF